MAFLVDPIVIPGADRVTFDPVRHLYFLDGRWRPNVTTILDKTGMQGDTSRFSQEDRDVGTATHLACALYLRGRLDLSSLHPRVKPRFDAFARWLAESGFICRASELRLWSDLGYTGTGDLFGHYPGESWITCIDFKGPWDPPAVGLQLAAYGQAFSERTGLVVRKRISLNLYGDSGGRAVPREQANRTDLTMFRNAHGVYMWRAARGLIELPEGVDMAA